MLWEPAEISGMTYGVTCPVSPRLRKIRAPEGVEVTLMLPVWEGTCCSQPNRMSAAPTARSTRAARTLKSAIILRSCTSWHDELDGLLFQSKEFASPPTAKAQRRRAVSQRTPNAI